MKLISVIVPVFNAEKEIEKCLKSILNQTYKDIEVIVINDGSTDNSLDVIKRTIGEDSRAKLIDIENRGVSAARNLGIKEATGEYFCFVDADDYIDETLIEQLVPYTEKDLDIVKYKAVSVDKEGNQLEFFKGEVFEEKNGMEAFNLLYADDVMLQVPWLYLYKKQYIIDNDFSYPEGRVHEDFARTILMILKANKMCSTNICGYYYVQTDISITRGNDDERTFQKSMDIIYHYDYITKEIEKYNLDEDTKINVKSYLANNVILEAGNLSGENQKKYIKALKTRKVFENIPIKNIKQLIKRILLKIDVNLYLKLR
ncbi:MAG: glycosyltransferase [Clostridia bacterium]|nr:glycosyltransferase [Clostridia bacterium]